MSGEKKEITIYNSLSRKKETFENSTDKVKLFVCGPTVYDLPHIGHARTYIAFDVITKWLRHRNYNVDYLQNITDIDDKIINRAKEASQDPVKLSREMEKIYMQDMKMLGINSVNTYARATDHISQIIDQVNTLLKKGYAYLIEGDGYYFDISMFDDYGKLSGRTVEQAEDATSRIDKSVGKRNKGDFCLWKFPSENAGPESGKNMEMKIVEGEPLWFSEKLGWGRPGWHIEDTAITEHHFGSQYDLHGGGIDLKFPHHEAEIAQQESASGKKPFVKIWMHTGHLLVEGEKMSKSKGNFITIRDFLARHSANILRMMVLSTHYRSPIDYSENNMQNAAASLANITKGYERIQRIMPLLPKEKLSTNASQLINTFTFDFSAAMDNDFNTPRAMATLYSFLNELESNIAKLTQEDAEKVLETLEKHLSILGIKTTVESPESNVTALLEERTAARNNKEWEKADKLRDKISDLGWSVEDTPHGSIVLKRDEKAGHKSKL